MRLDLRCLGRPLGTHPRVTFAKAQCFPRGVFLIVHFTVPLLRFASVLASSYTSVLTILSSGDNWSWETGPLNVRFRLPLGTLLYTLGDFWVFVMDLKVGAANSARVNFLCSSINSISAPLTPLQNDYDP